MAPTEQSERYKEQSVEEVILLALKNIRYGSVEIIIHDSKVVQIERRERTRFDCTLSRHNPAGSR